MKPPHPRIVAPACSLKEAQSLLKAGAHELYCGFLPPSWRLDYGEAETISRRQGRAAHVEDFEELRAIARHCAAAGNVCALALNMRYSPEQHPRVVELAVLWEQAGGQAVVVSDLALLLELEERQSGLQRHLSLLTGVFNADSCRFFADLDVSRVVLPRSMSLHEISLIHAANPTVELETLALYQQCPLIDGFCGFYHGVHLPENVPCDCEYTRTSDTEQPVVWSSDPSYEGHGCHIQWKTAQGTVVLNRQNDFEAPACAACQLPSLSAAGVSFLKLAGRGYPTEMLIQGVRFLVEAIELLKDDVLDEVHGSRTRALYERNFATSCHGGNCYFRAS